MLSARLSANPPEAVCAVSQWELDLAIVRQKGVQGVLLNEQEDEDGREDPLPPLDETRHDSDIGLTISHSRSFVGRSCRWLSLILDILVKVDDTFDIGLTIAHARRLGKALGG